MDIDYFNFGDNNINNSLYNDDLYDEYGSSIKKYIITTNEKKEEKKKISKEELKKLEAESWVSDNPFARLFNEYDPNKDNYDTIPLDRMTIDNSNNITFNLGSTDPINSGRRLYNKKTVIFKPNCITPLVGCNGVGKSTLLTMVKDILKDNHYFYLSYDNMQDGERHAKSEAIETFGKPDWERYSQLISSSEGENIQILSLDNIHKIEPVIRGEIIRDSNMYKFRDKGEHIFLLLDAVDSGSSIDNIINIIFHLDGLIDLAKENNKYLYIIIAANSYEFARNRVCWDVARSKEIIFKDYDDYRKFIVDIRNRILKQWRRSSKKEEE